MRGLHAEAWPVVEDRTLVGMIDRPNPDWHAQRHGHNPDDVRVRGCMCHEVVCCHEDNDCIEALSLMLDRHFRYLAVTDNEMHLVGIVSLEEILSAIIATDDDSCGLPA